MSVRGRTRGSEKISCLPNALQAELVTPKPVPPVPPRIPVGIPSEIARRRPDIRQAEAQLHATTADIGVAVANFYPSVTLTGMRTRSESTRIDAVGPNFVRGSIFTGTSHFSRASPADAVSPRELIQ